MKKTALLLVILIVCASLVASTPWQPVGRDEEKERYFELLVLKELLQPYQKRSNIEGRVKKIIIEQLGVKEGEVKSAANFVDDLGADSLDTVELIMALEKEFHTEIPDEEAEKITTVQEAVNYVSTNQESEYI